jgi:hypothetical protein
MRVLFSHIVTAAAMPRFRRTLKLQASFSEAVRDVDHLIITDLETAIDVNMPVLRTPLFSGGKFCLPVGRNLALKRAHEDDYDILLDGDADRVLISLPQCLPESFVSFVSLHLVGSLETDDDLVRKAHSGDLQFDPTSFYIIPRELMGLRFNEEFVGYAWSDVNFLHNTITPAGIGFMDCGARGIHVHHEVSPEAYKEAEENRRRFIRIWEEKNPGKAPPM